MTNPNDDMTPEATESFEEPTITDEAISEFIGTPAEEVTFHPILQIWQTIMAPVRNELGSKVTPQWGSRMVATYPRLEFADLETVRDGYYGRILELLEILEDEIAGDEDCLTYTEPEEDVEHNGGHYRAVLTAWQVRFLEWELAWNCTDATAAADLAAISEVHNMFFGQTGLTQYLDNIKFEFSESDQADLRDALNAVKEGQ